MSAQYAPQPKRENEVSVGALAPYLHPAPLAPVPAHLGTKFDTYA